MIVHRSTVCRVLACFIAIVVGLSNILNGEANNLLDVCYYIYSAILLLVAEVAVINEKREDVEILESLRNLAKEDED